ncbi:EAL and HDOD domain-containing protein [Acidisoma silvae]|uniref:EAL domain-containing protein n=1 Tax=Acidisoma silvae TaxID=2802396 RepID=A0A963YRW0_9PROT|nr:EAL domain-containing protein [Acidisoma silvae]MCB8875228.1 EAL domain-containing protein [Acidisoma silvae]
MTAFRATTEPERKGTLAADVFLGRQPIVGKHRELFAYELLFRSGQPNFAAVVDDVAATATVIDTMFSALGLQQALGDRRGFINVNADVLMSDIVEILPPSRIVLEILEHVDLTPAILARCKQLRARGFQLALDDVVDLKPEHRVFLHHVDYVKFEIAGQERAALAKLVRDVRAHGARPLAEKVEAVAQYEDCKAIGFDLFQGYFFARPTVLTARRMQPSKMVLIRILRLLAQDPDNSTLEVAVKEAPDLAMRLLRMASSAAFSPVHKVTSLRQAIFLLGHQAIGRLVQIMLFAEHGGTKLGSDPLVQTAAVRGRLMENLAVALGRAHLREEAFTVGILSLADSLFGQSMAELAELLNLADDLRAALVARSGALGQLLNLVEASESRDAKSLAAMADLWGDQDRMDFNRLQVEAIAWASRL